MNLYARVILFLSVVLSVGLIIGGALSSALAEPATSPDMKERLALARDLHDIRRIKDRIMDDIDRAAESLPPVERESFKKYFELSVDFDALEQKSITYTADIYTVPELKAMISYFGSPEGQSAEAKSGEYGEKLGGDVQKEIDKALMAAKYKNGGQSTPK